MSDGVEEIVEEYKRNTVLLILFIKSTHIWSVTVVSHMTKLSLTLRYTIHVSHFAEQHFMLYRTHVTIDCTKPPHKSFLHWVYTQACMNIIQTLHECIVYAYW